jgi:tRNA nucleotidyltransferase (CCA-adding enzyme)
MAYNERDGLIDLFSGLSDLNSGIIRTVGAPRERFSEDALRIMRALRFSAQLGFDIEERTLLAARRLSPRLKNIARERIGSEFIRLLASPEPERSLTLMDHVIYEILPVENIDKNSYVLCDAIGPDAFSRLALILYGKSNEELTGVAHALRLSNEQKKRMILLATPAEEKFECTALSARRFMRHYGDVWRGAARILTLLGSVSPDFKDAANAEAEKKPCLTIGGLNIDGSEIISLGLASGREVGALLSYLLDEVIRDPSLNERERLAEKAKSHLNIK